MRFAGRVQYKGLESERLANVRVYYHNNGQRCWFSVTIWALDYPDFTYNKNLETDAYKVDANTLFTQANMQGSLLLGDKLDEILAKEQEWLHELERMKEKC